MSYREREQDEGPDTAYEPCGVCGVVQADHGHMFVKPWFLVDNPHNLCTQCNASAAEHPTHDWKPPSDNSPDEPEED